MRVPAIERREQLIEASVRLMAREGVEAATLRAIAKEAGAPLASVHYCFKDKDELMQAAVEYWVRQHVGSLAGEADIQENLGATIKRIADEFWWSLEANSRDILAQLELALWAMREPGQRSLARSIYVKWERSLADVFDRALQASGEELRISTAQLARAFVGIVDAGSLLYLSDPRSSKAHETYNLLLESLLAAASL